MSYQTIVTAQDGASFVITLNRPDRRNAINVQMMDEILSAAHSADSDGSIRAIILTGGVRLFSGGADLKALVEMESTVEKIELFRRWHRLTRALEGLGKPVIAAIEGFCVTGGCELALACDMRIAGAGASFMITSSRIGTVAGAGGTQRLPRIVGIAKALEMMFSAEPIDAAEAHRIGLVNRVVPAGKALEEAKAMVAVYQQRAPLSLGFIKRAVYCGMQMDLASALEFETMLVTTIYGTDDKHEGITAFLEKRKANFKGS